MNATALQRQARRSQPWRRTQPWKVRPSYLLTIPEAAQQLGLTEGTLRRYCDRRLIGHITWRWKCGIIARAVRYIPRAAVAEFVERRASL